MNNRNIIKWAIVAATILVLAIFFSQPARANVQSPTFIAMYTSEPGESLDDFAHRIATRTRDITMQLDAEICGSFQTDGSRHRIQFYTDHSRWSCGVGFGNDGVWKATRLTMHTHTSGGGQDFSAGDNKLKLQGYVVSPRAITKRIGNRERTTSLPAQ